MKRKLMFNVVGSALLFTIIAGTAQAEGPHSWRTPPVYLDIGSGPGTVHCNLLNNAGKTVTVSNLQIRLVGVLGQSMVVADRPTPFELEDGFMFGGTIAGLPDPALFHQVYCEVDAKTTFSTREQNIVFSMTVIDKDGKVTVVAPPRRR